VKCRPPQRDDASAQRPGTTTYILPTDESEVYPEGLAVRGNNYYVTTIGTGEIFRGELDDPSAGVFHAYDGFGPMSGIKVVGNRLLVVNSEFTGPPSGPPWTMSSIPLP
jgi:hypothetical protein